MVLAKVIACSLGSVLFSYHLFIYCRYVYDKGFNRVYEMFGGGVDKANTFRVFFTEPC